MPAQEANSQQRDLGSNNEFLRRGCSAVPCFALESQCTQTLAVSPLTLLFKPEILGIIPLMSKAGNNRKPSLRWAYLLCALMLVFGSSSTGQWFCADGHLCSVCDKETASNTAPDTVQCDSDLDCCGTAPAFEQDDCRDCCEFVTASGERISASQIQTFSVLFDASLVPTNSPCLVPRSESVLFFYRVHAPPSRSVIYRLATPRAPPVSA